LTAAEASVPFAPDIGRQALEEGGWEMRFKLLAFGLVAVAAALGAGSVAPAAAETLQVGAYPANPPWENKKEDGSFEGFEVDLVNEIAKRIGADVNIQDLGFQALFAATSSGRIDMAISSITITNERLKSQSFTQGYYDSDMALATAKDSGVTSLADMKGKPVGVLSTSTGEMWVKENTEKFGFGEMKGYNAQQDLLLDTQNGRVAGAISDIAGLQFAFMKMPAMQVVERIKTNDRYGIMLQKDSPLLQRVNDAITEMKKDGTLAAIHKKWLGVDPDPGTSTVTVLDLPQAQ
jgi:polar amino acid transport system substrate-binding protein